MKIYKAPKRGIEIIELEAVRETESSFFILRRGKEEAVRKSNNYEVYFSEREKAVQFIKDRIERDIRFAQSSIERLENEWKMLD